jgi:Sec-independent protein translocase protein TatA
VPARASDDVTALQRKLELALEDRRQQGETNKQLNDRLLALQKQFDELSNQSPAGSGQQPQGSDQFKQLWEDAKKTIKTLQTELSTVKTELETTKSSAERDKLTAKAIAQIAEANVVNAEQLHTLLASRIVEKDGTPMVLSGGIEQDLKTYIESLRMPGSGFTHHFLPSGQRGMGAGPSMPPASAATTVTNPYITGNLTQQIALETSNPSMAAALEAEANRLKQQQAVPAR